MELMFKKMIWIALAASLLACFASTSARADEWNKKTVLTFSQPVEIPGQVLPAGTYTFKLVDTLGDRHVVEVYNADGSQILATIMTIPDYRLESTDETVIKFAEVPSGSPEVIRAWFYPGNKVGQEFVYSKHRALELAIASKAIVPAVDVDVANVEALKTAPIIAVTPEQKDAPVTVIQTTPPMRDSSASMTKVQESSAPLYAGQLPKTASGLPLIVLFGIASIAAAFGLMAFGRPSHVSVR
jgi:hypothetical protein